MGARREYVASGRNGYNAVDQLRPDTGTGTYGEPLIFRTRKDAAMVAAALNEAYEAGRRDAAAPEVKPMRPDELGRYVCVPADTCIHPGGSLTINSDGVWVKTGQQWSSAHRVCFGLRQEEL